jgi:hypothetical protein
VKNLICDECLNNKKCNGEKADVCKAIMSYIEGEEIVEDE